MTAAVPQLTLQEFAKRICSESGGPELGKVGNKFVCSMLVGIRRARSINLTDIAKALREDISLHATHKRLSRNLDDPDLAADLSDRLLQFGAARVGPETRLIVHLHELNKKHARKMEYLSASESATGGGFKVCEILASDPGSDVFTPLLASVWSDRVPGYRSDVDEIAKAMRRVLAATDDRGLWYFDDLSVPGRIIQPLMEDPKFDFIAMIRDESQIVYRNEIRPIRQLVEQVETRYGQNVFKLVPGGVLGASRADIHLFMHAGVLGIKLPDCDRRLSLIALRSKSAAFGEVIASFITSRTKLRSRKALMGLVESFLTMQDVLQAHRSLRDRFNPGDFRVLTYDRLQLLLTLLQTVLHYEASMVGSPSRGDHLIAAKPHDGEMDRTYLLPGHNA